MTYSWAAVWCAFLWSHLLGEKIVPVVPELARKGKSQAVFLLPLFKSKSKWKLDDGEVSRGVAGLEREGDSSWCVHLSVAVASLECGCVSVWDATGSSLSSSESTESQFRIIAGSKLRVWRSLRLLMLLEAGDEQEKTLCRSPCADAMLASPGGFHVPCRNTRQNLTRSPWRTTRIQSVNPRYIASFIQILS